jgi:hypothetical protein
MLLERTPEYWAREAPLAELQRAARAQAAWTEEVAELLDFAYLERSLRVLSRAQATAREDALALADHLERVAHDRAQAELDSLPRPYFARWRLLADLLHRCALRLDVPHRVLDRKHVRDILLRLHDAGGWLAQGDLTLIPNEGQRSATLKLMEQWDLIDRRADGAARLVGITELGRLAITGAIAERVAAARPAIALQRGCHYMYDVP